MTSEQRVMRAAYTFLQVMDHFSLNDEEAIRALGMAMSHVVDRGPVEGRMQVALSIAETLQRATRESLH